MKVYGRLIDGRHVKCACGKRIRLPLNDWPVLCDEGEAYLPVLVAVRCPACRNEVRLDK